jgi:hypothetical protein
LVGVVLVNTRLPVTAAAGMSYAPGANIMAPRIGKAPVAAT